MWDACGSDDRDTPDSIERGCGSQVDVVDETKYHPCHKDIEPGTLVRRYCVHRCYLAGRGQSPSTAESHVAQDNPTGFEWLASQALPTLKTTDLCLSLLKFEEGLLSDPLELRQDEKILTTSATGNT